MNIYMYDFFRDRYSLEELRPFLGEQRYEYCRRFKAEGAALRSAYAFMLLRIALKREHGISRVPEFVFNEHEKPLLSDYPDIWFSMSHSANAVICAVSETPVGADIQDIRNISLRAASKFLTPDEFAAVSSLSDEAQRSAEICRLWCIKESYGKMTGKGFLEGFSSFSAEKITEEKKACCIRRGNYYISACIK